MNHPYHIPLLLPLLVTGFLLLPGCGKSYKDSPPTNPVQTELVIDIVRYRMNDDDSERVVYRRKTNGFIALFNDSREEPSPSDWSVVGSVSFKDDDQNTTLLQLYRTPDGVPDGYQNGEQYFVKENLLADLEAWVAERETITPRRR